MPLDRRKIKSALDAKGFVRTERDHSYFVYHSTAGKKTSIRTKTSRGTSHKEIGDCLVSKMSRQCKLTNRDFNSLVNCTLSRRTYEEKLAAQGLLE